MTEQEFAQLHIEQRKFIENYLNKFKMLAEDSTEAKFMTQAVPLEQSKEVISFINSPQILVTLLIQKLSGRDILSLCLSLGLAIGFLAGQSYVKCQEK